MRDRDLDTRIERKTYFQPAEMIWELRLDTVSVGTSENITGNLPGSRCQSTWLARQLES